MKRVTLLLSAVALCFCASAQPPYFQQKVNTRIQVVLDDENHYLRGMEHIEYINNSPDTLRHIYMHLWPNAYSGTNTAFAKQELENGDTKFQFADEEARGFIDSLNFTVQSKFMVQAQAVQHYSHPDSPDIAIIKLPKPLAPNERVGISTPFRVKLPQVFSRLGHTKQAYFISQWYPKPAVYDNKGWHPIPYLNQGEFYSEFGSYDVSITLPENYIVMGTGEVDEKEHAWLDSIATKPMDSTQRSYKLMSYMPMPESAPQTKTIRFRAENVHDFAWFADKRWVVRKDTITVDANAKPIELYAAYLPGSNRYWKDATDYLRKTVKSYGEHVGTYPYSTIKAVEGDMAAGGGMEYPTVTIIDRGANSSLETVIVHEAGHNWFYGILASNERLHPWMDEGMNSFYEQKTIQGDQTGKQKLNEGHILYFHQVSTGNDQPVEGHSADFTELNYGGDVYYKTAMMMRWLEEYMGKEIFKTAMRDYYNTWKFRHPYPEDFRKIMESHTDKDLKWFFDGALTTDRPIDFKINRASANEVTITNKSSIPAPAGIYVYNEGDTMPSGVYYTPPFEGRTTLSINNPDWKKLSLSYAVPDVNTQNNYYKRNGLFHGCGLGLGLGANLNLGCKEKIYLLPALGYNYYDGFQLGLLFHNLTIPSNRFRFILAPTYGFGSKQFVGGGSAGYFFFPKKAFKEISIQVDAKTYHYDESGLNISDALYARYFKVAPSLNFIIKEPSLRSPVTRTLTLKAYSISEQGFNFNQNPVDSLFRPTLAAAQQQYYGLVRYTHENNRVFNPFSYNVEGQMGEDFAKLSLTGKVMINYNIKNKGLHLRGYAGKFFTINNTPTVGRYYLNSTYTGVNDYLYDGTYLGRTERDGIYGRQTEMQEGGFKLPTPYYASPIGRSDNWLLALNIKADLPIKLPFRVFADIGTFSDAKTLNPSGSGILYDAGIEFALPGDRLVISFPIVMSKDFRDYYKSIYGDNIFFRSITFSIRTRDLNWLKSTENLLNLLDI